MQIPDASRRPANEEDFVRTSCWRCRFQEVHSVAVQIDILPKSLLMSLQKGSEFYNALYGSGLAIVARTACLYSFIKPSSFLAKR